MHVQFKSAKYVKCSRDIAREFKQRHEEAKEEFAVDKEEKASGSEILTRFSLRNCSSSLRLRELESKAGIQHIKPTDG